MHDNFHEYVLEAEDISYAYEDGTRALKGVTLRIPRGRTTAVLGGNGAGKTTLFLNLTGSLSPRREKCL
jgi:cobalt/nickel transport system ATP-binding protein